MVWKKGLFKMKFDLKKSKLLFEVRYKVLGSKESYTYEMLYKRTDGKYFIHFEGGKYSDYSVKVGFCDFSPRSGNYFINKYEIDLWKRVALEMQKKNPVEYMVIDWEKEEKESIIDDMKINDNYMVSMGKLSEAELPF